MKNIVVAILVSIFCFPDSFAQRVETRKLNGDFDKLEVFGKLEVELVKSSGSEVKIKTDDDISLDDIKIEIKDRKLKISMTAEIFSSQKKVNIQVPFNEIREIETSGGADVRSFDAVTGDKIDFKAVSGGNLYLTVHLKTLDAKVTQGSTIVFEGDVESQVVSASSGGVYSAYDLECNDSYVGTSTGGKAKVTANHLLDAKATSKGWIGYTGKPKDKNIKESLGGVVEEGVVNEN